MARKAVEVEGDDELLGKLHPELVGPPIRTMFHKWGVTTQGDARTNAPVNDNRLRSSIVYELGSGVIPEYVRVGTNARHGPFMEGGTGRLSDITEGPDNTMPSGGHRRHWPPAEALEPWARKHGTTGKSVAFFIGRRGGLRPRRFLRGAFEHSQRRLPMWMSEAARDMERRAEVWRGVGHG